MTNNSFDLLSNRENAENDGESRESFNEKTETSSKKEIQESATTTKTTEKESDIEEKVAEKVEGVPIIEDDNGVHFRHEQEEDNNNSLTSDDTSHSSSITSDKYYHNNDHSKIGDNINRPLHPSLEPSTPEEIVEDWERLHNTSLPKKEILLLKLLLYT